MNRKSIVFAATAILVISVAWILTAQDQDFENVVGPPGIMSDELWVPISENSGIALSISESDAYASRGTLMIKIGEKWERIYWVTGPAHLERIR